MRRVDIFVGSARAGRWKPLAEDMPKITAERSGERRLANSSGRFPALLGHV